jgi:hypothetical protein
VVRRPRLDSFSQGAAAPYPSLAYARAYNTSDERAAELPRWLHRYNWHRPHGGIKAQTPISRLGLTEDKLAELFDVDVDQFAGMFTLIAPQRLRMHYINSIGVENITPVVFEQILAAVELTCMASEQRAKVTKSGAATADDLLAIVRLENAAARAPGLRWRSYR